MYGSLHWFIYLFFLCFLSFCTNSFHVCPFFFLSCEDITLSFCLRSKYNHLSIDIVSPQHCYYAFHARACIHFRVSCSIITICVVSIEMVKIAHKCVCVSYMIACSFSYFQFYCDISKMSFLCALCIIKTGRCLLLLLLLFYLMKA